LQVPTSAQLDFITSSAFLRSSAAQLLETAEVGSKIWSRSGCSSARHRRNLFTDLAVAFLDAISLSFEGDGGSRLGEHGFQTARSIATDCSFTASHFSNGAISPGRLFALREAQ
jgi:hypothetical protein